MDGWNTSFLLRWPIFRCYVSFREGTPSQGYLQGVITPICNWIRGPPCSRIFNEQEFVARFFVAVGMNKMEFSWRVPDVYVYSYLLNSLKMNECHLKRDFIKRNVD